MAFYEHSNASGLFRIEFASVGLKDDWSNAWIVSHKEKTIASGPDAEGTLASLVASGEADRLRLPKRLIDWRQIGRAYDRPVD